MFQACDLAYPMVPLADAAVSLIQLWISLIPFWILRIQWLQTKKRLKATKTACKTSSWMTHVYNFLHTSHSSMLHIPLPVLLLFQLPWHSSGHPMRTYVRTFHWCHIWHQDHHHRPPGLYWEVWWCNLNEIYSLATWSQNKSFINHQQINCQWSNLSSFLRAHEFSMCFGLFQK